MDLISRQAAIDALKEGYWDRMLQSAADDPCIVDAMIDWAIRKIKGLPSAQPEQRMGKWMPVQNNDNWTELNTFICTACGERFERFEPTKFCPNCGARMTGWINIRIAEES